MADDIQFPPSVFVVKIFLDHIGPDQGWGRFIRESDYTQVCAVVNNVKMLKIITSDVCLNKVMII